MLNTEQAKEDLEELKRYSSRLFDFILENYDKPITHLSQIEFNCLFRVYSDKINYICDTFKVQEEQLSDYLIDSQSFDSENNEKNADKAIDLFFQYIEGFMLIIENSIPLGVAN